MRSNNARCILLYDYDDDTSRVGMMTVQFKPIVYEVHDYECMYA